MILNQFDPRFLLNEELQAVIISYVLCTNHSTSLAMCSLISILDDLPTQGEPHKALRLSFCRSIFEESKPIMAPYCWLSQLKGSLFTTPAHREENFQLNEAEIEFN